MSETQPKNIVTPTDIAAALKDCRTAREIHGITRRINGLMDEAMEKAAGNIACKKDCHYCCHYRVVVQPHEVFAIVDHLRDDPAHLKRALGQAKENRKLIDQLTFQEHVATNIPCPFLEDGVCSVYAVRPAKCRAYHSRDVGVCERAHTDTTITDLHPVDPDLVLATQTLERVTTTAFRMAGFQMPYYELNGALLDVFGGGDPGKRWRDGKKPFGSRHETTV